MEARGPDDNAVLAVVRFSTGDSLKEGTGSFRRLTGRPGSRREAIRGIET